MRWLFFRIAPFGLIYGGCGGYFAKIAPFGLTGGAENDKICLKMKTTSMTDIAAIVRNERKRQGATQVELSQMANVGIRFLRDVEDGKPSVHFDKLMRILTILGIGVDIKTRDEAAR